MFCLQELASASNGAATVFEPANLSETDTAGNNKENNAGVNNVKKDARVPSPVDMNCPVNTETCMDFESELFVGTVLIRFKGIGCPGNPAAVKTKDEFFKTSVGFMAHIATRPLKWGEFKLCKQLRGILVMMHFGLVRCFKTCPHCKGPVHFAQHNRSDRKNFRYMWMCSQWQAACGWRQSVGGMGFLSNIKIENWLPFLFSSR